MGNGFRKFMGAEPIENNLKYKLPDILGEGYFEEMLDVALRFPGEWEDTRYVVERAFRFITAPQRTANEWIQLADGLRDLDSLDIEIFRAWDDQFHALQEPDEDEDMWADF